MLQHEHPWNGRLDLIRYYSDNGKKIMQSETGTPYDDAIDTYPSEYHYVETEIPIGINIDS